MHPLLEALLFGLTVAAMFVGLFGIILPIIPGIILIYLSALAYAVLEGFNAVGWLSFTVITLIALVAVTADLWMPILGAKQGGASKRAMLFGLVGGILGFVILTPMFPLVGSIFGGIIGYAIGTLLGQYHKYQDWEIASRASIGSIAGWGVSMVVQMIGGILIVSIFIWQVLSF
jgi:uncharacterized protein YqgC (DUF456 family)